ncbi:MAG: helix-turn-helix domain-containing protein [Candidatus Doudnabacteria bacterium]
MAEPETDLIPRPALREIEKRYILEILEYTGWDKKKSAKILEISRGTLYRKILVYGLIQAKEAV